MKKCRRCSKPATLHITEVRKGEVNEIHLCETCATEYLNQPEETQPPEPDFAFEKLGEPDIDAVGGVDERTCPNCGITFREFRSLGRLGCSHDYVEFQSDLISLLENIHGETQHCGKMPRRAPAASRRQHELVRLRNELKVAIEDEKYEDAARLRDEIHRVELDESGRHQDETDGGDAGSEAD